FKTTVSPMFCFVNDSHSCVLVSMSILPSFSHSFAVARPSVRYAAHRFLNLSAPPHLQQVHPRLISLHTLHRYGRLLSSVLSFCGRDNPSLRQHRLSAIDKVMRWMPLSLYHPMKLSRRQAVNDLAR